MSRRKSTGDLVPKDITEILAREARAQRGHKKSGSSLGQAFSWLKGSKRKKTTGNGLNRVAIGVTVAVQNHDAAKAGPKGTEEQKKLSVHYTASQHYQENVFIEGNRPQYLEDLHSEAQEGLKILQEENKNGESFPDDESIASTNTLQPEQDISSKDEDGCPELRSPTGNTDISASSAVSTRPVLNRQGSTFKPLNPVKSIDRNKKRSRRTTIMGIPNQVQKELALRRHSTFQQLPENDKGSDSQSGVVIIPTVDGGSSVENKEGARVHLSELEVSREEKLLQKHLQALYQNEQHFTFQGFGHHVSPSSMLRPKSVALPGMTSSLSSPSTVFSFLQEPQGPVMSISPQATYMSTIIPNAVLPASVEVIEIDHCLSRTRGSSVNHGSIRTVSKSSLGSGDSPVSPLLSRRSDMDGSQADTSQNDSAIISASTSASNLGESSKTIVLIPSPASSKRSTCSGGSQSMSGQGNQQDHTAEDQDLVSIHSSVSIISYPTSTSEHFDAGQATETGMAQADVEDKKNKRRSLSVTKTKQPPAPPRRTNSLHCTKIRNNTKMLVESQTLNESVATVSEQGEVTSPASDASRTPVTAPTPNSVSENGETQPKSEANVCSPHKTLSDAGKFERTISPSSGYSSQSGTPTLSPKGISPSSPEKQKKSPVKPERSMSRAPSSAASPSSSLTSLSSGTSEPIVQDSSISPVATKDPINCTISPALTMEIKGLLNIPPPPKVRAPCPPPPEVWAHSRRSVELICTSYGNVCKVNQASQSQDGTMKQAGTQTDETELPLEKNIEKTEMELSERKQHVEEMPLGEATPQDNVHSADLLTQDAAVHLDLPVVTVTMTEEQLSTKHTEEEPKSSQTSNNTSETHANHSHATSIDTLSIDVPKLAKDSPPPTPPPTYHPTPPPSRRTPPSTLTLSVGLPKVHEDTHVAESCWPPPPPPLEGDSTFEGGDETDFPLPPPPPLATEHLIDIPDQADQKDLNGPVVDGKENSGHCVISLQEQTQASPNTLSNLVLNTPALSCPSKCDSLKAGDLFFPESNAQALCPAPDTQPPPQTSGNPPSAVTFRRQPSVANRAKEFHSRHKSMPMAKEDANIPLVTPSLLQMVRLRSVSMAEEQGNSSSEETLASLETIAQESCPVAIQSPQNVPQKPIRKSLSIKSSPQTSSATINPPSVRLQEAIRMKTAAMSTREGLLARPGVRLPPYHSISEPGSDMHKSPATTASFIFSRSNKKVVFDTAGHSPEARMTLKHNLAAELMQVSEHSKSIAYSNGGIKSVPPPVAKKPGFSSGSPIQTLPGKMEVGIRNQIAPLETTTTRVTADTIETLF